MKLFRNTAIIIVAVIFLNIIASSIVEVNAINTSRHNLKMATNIASKYAVESFQITQFSGFDDDLGMSYDISDSHNKNAYLNYLNSLESQANNLGFNANGSDFQSVINFLKEDINVYDPTNPDSSVISPFAFNWTFLEQKRLEREFQSCLTSIINANYNPGDTIALTFSGTNVLRIKSVTVEIDNGPTLVNLADGLNPNGSLYRTYLKLFGSTKSGAADMIDGINAFDIMYNYIITYDVKFTVEWEHNTITPFFSTFGHALPEAYLNERGQLKIGMTPLVIERKYTIIN